VNLGGGLLCALEATVDLDVQLAQPRVEGLDERLEAAVDRGVAILELAGRRALKLVETGPERLLSGPDNSEEPPGLSAGSSDSEELPDPTGGR
jgi:hypothetical protein